MFTLTPEVISGAEVIRLIHKVNISFYNPSSRKEQLFWRGFVLRGYIDIPENLKEVSSTINPEDIYSFRDFKINGKPAPFEKVIRCRTSSEVEYQIPCRKIAAPKRTYDVSYVEDGLYKTNDFYEDEIRTSLPNILITVDKPPALRVSVNSFGRNANLKVLKNSSRLALVTIGGKLTSGNGFSLHWEKSEALRSVNQNTTKLDRIYEIVANVEKGQQTMMAAIREVKEEVIDGQGLSREILTIVQDHPECVESLLTEQLRELRQIFLKAAKELEDKNPQKAREAKKWYGYLGRGISATADVIQIVAFLTGISSLPALANSEIAQRIIEFLSRIARTF